MKEEKPLINHYYLLEKSTGKGGWTYAQIPEIAQNKNSPFGWVKVKGSIDNVEINNYHLMPMGNGKLFLPVKAAIRKMIKKEAGDTVHVILFLDVPPTKITEELKICMQDEHNVYDIFLTFTKHEQQDYINWIYSAKTDEIKVERIAKTITLVKQHKKWNNTL